MEKTAKLKVIKCGYAHQALLIPKSEEKRLGLKHGDKVTITFWSQTAEEASARAD